MPDSEFIYLKWVATVGAIFGQFPVKNLKNGLLSFKLFSPLGIWSIALSLVHLSLVRTIFACIGIQNNEFFGGSSGLRRGAGLLPIMSWIYLTSVYIIYLFWLCALPYFLKVWKGLISYDAKYSSDGIGKTRFGIFAAICQLASFFLETLMNATSFKASVSLLGKVPVEFQEISWIFEYIDANTASWLVAVHIGICHFSTGLSILFILEFSHHLRRRIRRVEEILRRPLRNKQINICNDQIIELMDIFENLRRASSLIVITFLGFALVLITINVFLILVNIEMLSFNSAIFEFALLFILYFTSTISKVVLLTNSGESLLKTGEQLRRTILKISPDLALDPENLSHLKFLALDIDFQLSGCGYFVLNRTALTGMLSSVITYNVVLAQFEASEKSDPKLQ